MAGDLAQPRGRRVYFSLAQIAGQGPPSSPLREGCESEHFQSIQVMPSFFGAPVHLKGLGDVPCFLRFFPGTRELIDPSEHSEVLRCPVSGLNSFCFNNTPLSMPEHALHSILNKSGAKLLAECQAAIGDVTALWAQRAKLWGKAAMADKVGQVGCTQRERQAIERSRVLCPWHAQGLRCQIKGMYNRLRDTSPVFAATRSCAFWCTCTLFSAPPTAVSTGVVGSGPADAAVVAWMVACHAGYPAERIKLGKHERAPAGRAGRGRSGPQKARCVF